MRVSVSQGGISKEGNVLHVELLLTLKLDKNEEISEIIIKPKIKKKEKIKPKFVFDAAKNNFLKSEKADKRCSKCKEIYEIEELHFHHIKFPKIAGLSEMAGDPRYFIEDMISERAKCIILCKNCHINAHRKIAQNPLGWK